jgi:hypothetical protein
VGTLWDLSEMGASFVRRLEVHYPIISRKYNLGSSGTSLMLLCTNINLVMSRHPKTGFGSLIKTWPEEHLCWFRLTDVTLRLFMVEGTDDLRRETLNRGCFVHWLSLQTMHLLWVGVADALEGGRVARLR